MTQTGRLANAASLGYVTRLEARFPFYVARLLYGRQ